MNADNILMFIWRLMNLSLNISFDAMIFQEGVVKFSMYIKDIDEFAENILLADSIRIISSAQHFGAKLIDNNEEYYYEQSEEIFGYADFDNYEEEYQQLNDEDYYIYLDHEEFDSLERGLFFEGISQEKEIEVSFTLQFKGEKEAEKFLNIIMY